MFARLFAYIFLGLSLCICVLTLLNCVATYPVVCLFHSFTTFRPVSDLANSCMCVTLLSALPPPPLLIYSALRTLFVILSCLGIIYALVLLFLVFKLRKRPTMRAGGVVYGYLMILGCCMAYITAILLTRAPNGKKRKEWWWGGGLCNLVFCV